MKASIPLASSLGALREKYASLLKPELTAIMERHFEEVRASGLLQDAKNIGDDAPPFALSDGHAKVISSKELLSNGPLVVTFSRGTWCPYCVAELRSLSEIVSELTAGGASIVAISPQSPEHRDVQVERDLRFPILYDVDNKVGKQFGLVYRFPDDLRTLYDDVFKNSIPSQNGTSAWELPISARYVVAPNGHIADAQLSPDYRDRPEPTEIFDILRELG